VIFLHELIFSLLMVRVFGDAVHGTDVDALGFIEMTHAFCAELGVDLIDLFPLIDRPIWAFGFTDITVDAFIGNDQRHRLVLP